ncbi:MAG: hypothetical protein JO177_01140 [Candidatus Eremiobacteraeota bacterium]|nr:hypothetical protein [Candidatus Eremiobacteraeota bacterium]
MDHESHEFLLWWLFCKDVEREQPFSTACFRIAQEAAAPGLLPHESQIERQKHQDDADIRHQSLPKPESMPKEQKVDANDGGCHRDNVKRCRHIPRHANRLITRRLSQSVSAPRRRHASESPMALRFL